MAITLNSCQQAAVDSFIKFLYHPNQSELVISGFAGTGKTTLVEYILDNLSKFEEASALLGKKMHKYNDVAVTATTRKAAHVIAKSLGTEPLTIHSWLGLVVRNCYETGGTKLTTSKKTEVKENCLVFIDEASFMDMALLSQVRKCLKNCKVIFMGDPCQLLQVNTKSSPVFDGKIPTVYLTTVMRNEGPIEKLSAQFRESVLTGQFSELPVDKSMVKHVDGKSFQQMINDAFTAPDYSADDSAKILAWSNARVHDYNEYVATARNIHEPFAAGEVLLSNKPIIDISGKIMAGTDSKVRVLSSRQAVKEDITGYIVSTDKAEIFVPTDKQMEKALLKHLANQKNWKKYFHIKDHWGDLRPAYASTVHKSQGSTYSKVFIDLSDVGRCNDPDSLARLLYVASSRASTEVVLYGQLPDKYLGVNHEGEQLLYA